MSTACTSFLYLLQGPPNRIITSSVSEEEVKSLDYLWRLTPRRPETRTHKATRRKLESRNSFNAKLNNFRNKQYSTMVEENKDNPITLFRVINKSLHRKQSSPLPPGLTNAQLAQTFSDFFTNKIDKIRENIDSQQSELENDDIITPDGNHEALFDEFLTLTESEVEKLIKGFPNKQCELDPLPLSMLKECLHIVLPHITKIVNLTLRLGALTNWRWP